MPTSGSARSATTFTTADTAIPERPRVPVTIGSREYTARAPKIDVWREVTKMLGQIDQAKKLASKEQRSEAEDAELDALMDELVDLERLEEAVIIGVDIIDEGGATIAIRGGFLRRCLSKDDWLSVYREWKDDDSDLDVDHLFATANHLREEFTPWFNGRQAAIGLPDVAAADSTRPRRKTVKGK